MRFLLFYFSSTILAQTEYPRTTSVLLLTRHAIVRQFWRTEAQSFSFGFDLRTLQREVWLFTLADGYVSRIKISPFEMVKRFI
jgi:hypothetical protein